MLRRATASLHRETQRRVSKFFSSAADHHDAPKHVRPPPKPVKPLPEGPVYNPNVSQPGWYTNEATKNTIKDAELYPWLKDFPKDTPESQTGRPNGVLFYTATYGTFLASVAGGYWMRVSGLNEVETLDKLGHGHGDHGHGHHEEKMGGHH